MIEERTEELASLYALGLLSAEESAYFEDLMLSKPELAPLVVEFQEAAAALAHSAPVIAPPPAVRSRLLAAIQSEIPAPESSAASATSLPSSSASHGSWFPWAMAAGLAILTGFLLFDRAQLQQNIGSLQAAKTNAERDVTNLRKLGEASKDRIATLSTDLQSLNTAHQTTVHDLGELQAEHNKTLGELADLKNQDQLSKLRIATLSSKMNNSPQTVGSVAWDGDKQRGVLTLEKIPPAGPAQDYQLWIIDPQYPQPISGGIVHVDENGDARIVFKVEVPIHAADKFAVSRERKGGAPSAQGPIVMMGQ